jgi:hypothetical protein
MKKLRQVCVKKKKKKKSPIIVHNDFAKERKKKKCINSPLRDSKSHGKSTVRPRNTRFCQRKINTVIYLFL